MLSGVTSLDNNHQSLLVLEVFNNAFIIRNLSSNTFKSFRNTYSIFRPHLLDSFLYPNTIIMVFSVYYYATELFFAGEIESKE